MGRPLFHIGFEVSLNNDTWVVHRYHKVMDDYEVLLRNKKDGRHVSVKLKQLEAAVK